MRFAKIGYREDIDVLRGVSIVLVLLFHFSIPPFKNGFVGVDIFFVISGFLITNIILREHEDQKFRYVNFLARRARRLLPSLYLLMVVVLAVSIVALGPLQVRVAAEQVISSLFFVSNWYFASQTGYFGAEAKDFVLLHTWSLSIEEQFYLIWPLLLLVLIKTRLRMLVLLIAAGALLISVWAYAQFPESAFYLTHARMWALLGGCAVAILLPKAGLEGSYKAPIWGEGCF